MVDSAGFSEEESQEAENEDTPRLTRKSTPKVTSSSLSGTQGNLSSENKEE